MANTAISDIAGKVALSSGPELLKSGLGDGSIKPGSQVSFNSTTGKVQTINPGTTNMFEGILLARYDSDVDTAPGDGKSVNIAVPKTGRLYAVIITDQAGAKTPGEPLKFATAGLTAGNPVTENIVAHLEEPVANGDTVAIVRWA